MAHVTARLGRSESSGQPSVHGTAPSPDAAARRSTSRCPASRSSVRPHEPQPRRAQIGPNTIGRSSDATPRTPGARVSQPRIRRLRADVQQNLGAHTPRANATTPRSDELIATGRRAQADARAAPAPASPVITFLSQARRCAGHGPPMCLGGAAQLEDRNGPIWPAARARSDRPAPLLVFTN
jgi:hypothetical protein